MSKIKKLEKVIYLTDEYGSLTKYPDVSEMFDKINEIIDKVNKEEKE